MENVIETKEEIFFIAKPNLFTIGIITLPKLKILSAVIFGAEVGTCNIQILDSNVC
jgi:hypothetical protein